MTRTFSLSVLVLLALASAVGVGASAAAPGTAHDGITDQRAGTATGPAANGSGEGGTATGPGANATAGAANATGNATANATRSKGPFAFRTGNVTDCGLTCRQLNVTLTNTGNETLENVSVQSTVLANRSVIVRRQADVGTLAPNESATRTVRVQVGFAELSQIQRNGGNITIRTNVTSAQHNQTFVTRRTVL
ncbi:MAG: hypothetical protein ABEJ31_03425 [Haloarculaceae archaeon]